MTVERPEPSQTRLFRAEVRGAVRYERGRALKAVAVLAGLAVILVLRALYFG